MNNNDTIQCNGCTLCCENISKRLHDASTREWSKELVKEFPYKPGKDGNCEMLINGKCSVYADRPAICDTNKTFVHQKLTNSKTKWIELQKSMCRTLKIQKKLSILNPKNIMLIAHIITILFFVLRKPLSRLFRN